MSNSLPTFVRAHYASADEPSLRSTAWIEQQWQLARERAATRGATPVLALDEIQKLPGWSETVKRLWDEDARSGCPLRVVLLGSAPLLVQRGLGGSLRPLLLARARGRGGLRRRTRREADRPRGEER